MCVRAPLAHACMRLRVLAQLHLEYLFQTVCVKCMISLSERAFRGYTNTEEGYLYFEEIVVVSVRSGLLESDLIWSWSNLNLFPSPHRETE